MLLVAREYNSKIMRILFFILYIELLILLVIYFNNNNINFLLSIYYKNMLYTDTDKIVNQILAVFHYTIC